MSVTIDSTTYDISVKSLRRKARFKRKYLESTEDGTAHTELTGVYFDYTLVFNAYLDAAEYSLLWAKLTEATEFHTVTVPSDSGNYQFTAYFDGVGDEIFIQRSGTDYFQELTVNFTAQSPENTP